MGKSWWVISTTELYSRLQKGVKNNVIGDFVLEVYINPAKEMTRLRLKPRIFCLKSSLNIALLFRLGLLHDSKDVKTEAQTAAAKCANR